MRKSSTMQRLRRLVPLAMVAVLGVAGLTGCRSNPTVAAYIGGQQVGQKSVNSMVDELSKAVDALPAESRSSILTCSGCATN